jgi:tetratricopeptide (TPR) repeat protein
MKNQMDKKQQIILIYVALALAVFIGFEQVRRNDFVDYDDHIYVTENLHVKSGLTSDGIIWAFTTGQEGNWHPLTWLSHMLDYELFGLNPGWHHLTSVLFHIANTLLLFWVLKKMTDALWPSLFVAAAFALHPLHVESVAWIAERKDVLSGLFWMLTIACYIRYTEQPSIKRYLLVFVVFALGLMAKPMLVTLPFVLLLLDYWPLGRLQWGHQTNNQRWSAWYLVREKIPLFILTIASSVITFIVQQKGGAMDVGESYSLGVRISNALVCYVGYIIKMVYPARLAVLYPHPGDSLPMWQVIVSLLIIVAASAGVIYAGRRRRYLAVGWFWYLGTLVPVIGLVQVGAQAMADRYTYLPSIGIFIVVGWGIGELAAKWRYRETVPGICAGVVLAVFLICTRLQVRYWQNSSTLYEHTLAATENNYLIHYNYGCMLLKKRQFDESIKHFEETLRINPGYSKARQNIGVAFLEQGKEDEAVKHLNETLHLEPNSPLAYYNIGNIYHKLGKLDEAVVNYNKALTLNPDLAEAHHNLGLVLRAQGKLDEAISQYRQALQLKGDYTQAHNNLGVALRLQGRVDEAISHYRQALKFKDDYAEAHNNLGIALQSQGKYDEAAAHLKRVVELAPNSASAHYNLGTMYYEQGKHNLAINHWTEALKLKPDFISLLNNLGWILATTEDTKLRNPTEAVKYAQRACEMTGYNRPDFLDTLATAYAASGNFPEAVKTAEKAVALAMALEQKELAAKIQKRLELYKAKTPYHERSD